MRIPISDLPQPIINRLLDVQRDPSAYDGYYQKGGGRGGAITGIIICGIIALLGIPMATSTSIPFPVWAVVYALLSVGIWASIRRLKRFANATLKPLIFLNPLYVVRTTLDEVRYYSLWNELKHLQITHHHTNGVYNYTTFEFRFDGGAAETITVRPKAFAEQLASMIDAYRQRMISALEQQDFESIMAHDLFVELRMNEGQVPQSAGSKPKKSGALMTWAVGSAIGLFIGSGLWLFNYTQMQKRSLRYSCERSYSSVESCQRYFNRWAIQFYTDAAQEALTDAYKRYFKKNKAKVSRLRRMMLLKDVPHVTAEQKKEIIALYSKGSRKALDTIYADIITKYKARAKEADPTARAAIVKMIEMARDNDLFRVRISYAGKTAEISAPINLGPKYDNKVAVSAAPSFTPALNKSRENIISRAIEKAFNAIIPREVLEFSHHSSKAYTAKYDYRSRFLPKLKKPQGKPDITFDVGYKVYRSGSVYSQRSVSRANKRYYVGVGFEWDFNIAVKSERLHHFNQRSRPPSTFSVRSRRRRGSHLSRASIYARMAETAFDNFSDKITRHFGIYRAGSYSKGLGTTTPRYDPSKYSRDLKERLRRLRERLKRNSRSGGGSKYRRSTRPKKVRRPARGGNPDLRDMANGM